MFRIDIDMLSRIISAATTSAASIPLHIIQSHILPRLDGAALVSTSCASSQLRSLCNDDQLWRDICNSTWPSTTDSHVLRAISAFPSSHRSFYSDSFPSTCHELPRITCSSDMSKLISAVDIYYKDKGIYSKVLETETVSDRFSSHYLQLHLLGLGETVPTPLKSERIDGSCMSLLKEHLRVSWIVIDPNNKRAVNISSHKAVDSMLWFTHDIRLRYGTVAAVATGELVQFAVFVTCGWRRRELHVKEVRMHILDFERAPLSGRESMGILQAAMEGRRRRIDSKMQKAAYEKFLREKGLRQRRREARHSRIMAFGILILFGIIVIITSIIVTTVS